MWTFENQKTDRLDRILRSIPEPGKEWLSRQAWDWLLENARVKRNGRVIKKGGESISAGEIITVDLPGEVLGLLTAPTTTSLIWMHPKKEWALFFKNVGVASLPIFPWTNSSFVNEVMHFLKGYDVSLSQKFAQLCDPPNLEGGLVQRLDTDTSGLLTVAFTAEAKAKFRQVFSRHEAEKTYLAIVHRKSAFLNQNFSFYLDVKDRAKVRVLSSEGGERCELKFTTLSTNDHFSLLQIKTCFGQRHLVRVTSAHLGHPLVGDRLYGDGSGAAFHQLHGLGLQFLAKDLPHDIFHAPPPKSFLDCVQECGLQYLA